MISSFRVMESYETGSSCYGRVNDGGGCDANDRRIAQIEKAFGSAGQACNVSVLKWILNPTMCTLISKSTPKPGVSEGLIHETFDHEYLNGSVTLISYYCRDCECRGGSWWARAS